MHTLATHDSNPNVSHLQEQCIVRHSLCALRTCIIATSFAPSPMDNVIASVDCFTSSTTSAFCLGVTLCRREMLCMIPHRSPLPTTEHCPAGQSDVREILSTFFGQCIAECFAIDGQRNWIVLTDSLTKDIAKLTQFFACVLEEIISSGRGPSHIQSLLQRCHSQGHNWPSRWIKVCRNIRY